MNLLMYMRAVINYKFVLILSLIVGNNLASRKINKAKRGELINIRCVFRQRFVVGNDYLRNMLTGKPKF